MQYNNNSIKKPDLVTLSVDLWVFRARDDLRPDEANALTSSSTKFKCEIILNFHIIEFEKASNRNGIEKNVHLTFGLVCIFNSGGRKDVSLIFNYYIWRTLNRKVRKNGLPLFLHIFSLIIHIFKKFFDNVFGRGFDYFFVLAIHCSNAVNRKSGYFSTLWHKCNYNCQKFHPHSLPKW